MKRCDTWQADRIRFQVSGRGAQHFLTAAAGRGVRLEQIRCTAEGYTAAAAGADRALLQTLAEQGGWQFAVLRRRGPGRWLDRLLARPGVPAGAAVFLVLVRLLTGFVWAIDFGTLDPGQIPALRTLLAEHTLWEGAWADSETLAAAQAALSARSEEFGWVSLNFTGGCLLLEAAPAEFRQVQPEPSASALTAKADGEVLAVEVESGFAQGQPGQFVAQGQLLASAEKLDRSGRVVSQPVRGRVLGRIRCQYEAQIPLTVHAPVLTGRHTRHTTLYLLGRCWQRETPPAFADSVYQTEWQPLTLGRLALPGCLYRVTGWERAEQTVSRSPKAALALARRDCLRQLREQFPDAVIETQQRVQSYDETEARCTMRYVITADLAAETP